MVEKKIDERTFDFSLMIVDVYKYLLEEREFVLSKQLLRSGTSIVNILTSWASDPRVTQIEAETFQKSNVQSRCQAGNEVETWKTINGELATGNWKRSFI